MFLFSMKKNIWVQLVKKLYKKFIIDNDQFHDELNGWKVAGKDALKSRMYTVDDIGFH